MRRSGALLGCLAALAVSGVPIRLLAQGNVAEQYLLAAANQERVARGLTRLAWDDALAGAAVGHARAMARNHDISHQFAGEAELAERASAAGARFTLVAENVAEAPSATELQRAWMTSLSHRENLLDAKVTAVGIAVVVRGHQMYAVEDFARITQALSFVEQEEAVRRLVAQSGVNLLADTSDARPACATETNFSGSRRPGFIMRYTATALDRLPDALAERLRSGRYRAAAVGACEDTDPSGFSGYRLAVLLYF